MKAAKLRSRTEEFECALSGNNVSHMLNCVRKIATHAAATGDTTDADLVLARVTDALDRDARIRAGKQLRRR